MRIIVTTVALGLAIMLYMGSIESQRQITALQMRVTVLEQQVAYAKVDDEMVCQSLVDLSRAAQKDSVDKIVVGMLWNYITTDYVRITPNQAIRDCIVKIQQTNP